MFAFSCKQANNGGVQKPTISDEITITVSGDEGVTVNKLNIIKVKKSLNLTWKDIKKSAEATITTKENKEIKEWRLKDAKGAVLKDADAFEKDEVVWCVSKDKEKPTPPTNPITITIEVDEGYTFKEATKPCTIEAQKGGAWSSIKEKAEAKIELKDGYEKTGWKLDGKDGSYLEDSAVFNENALIFATSKKKDEPDKPKENFEIKEWHLNNKDGTLIKDETEFKENVTIFAVSKENKKANYKVEHFLQNLENEEYTLKETEKKQGEAGKNTEATAKQYEGFTCQGLAQSIIKADGSTVVQIKYKRNRVFLILDLAGGTTTTLLEDGIDGRKLLSGKFESEVSIETPTKKNVQFDGWEPELPTHFPAKDETVYTAKWVSKTAYRVNIEGDERVKVAEPQYIEVPVASNKTIGDIKSEIEGKVSLSDGWQTEDYCFYDWRMGGEKGEEMLDSTQITEDMTVYARTNYKRFKISGTTIKGYEGEKPRGRIFIPKTVEIIKEGAFEYCHGLKAVDLSGCTKLTRIGGYNYNKGAFSNCRSLESIDLSSCTNLRSIGANTFYRCSKLKSVNLAGCSKITKILNSVFENCASLESIDLSSCTKLTEIGKNAFSDCSELKSVNLTGCIEITEIGGFGGDSKGAFENCASLESIDLSPCIKLTRIVSKTFKDCSNLKSVSLSGCAELTDIGWEAFENCASLESIDLSPCTKLTRIAGEIFKDCWELKSMNLAGCSKITKILDSAFENCASLESIDLSPCTKLTKIGKRAFKDCSNLKSVDLTGCAELTEIEEDNRYNYGVFENCVSLESIDLSPCSKLTKIGNVAFRDCSKLKSVNLAGCSELTEIGLGAFENCASLESIDLSPCSKLTKIGNKAFKDCSKLKSVNLSGCSELTEIEEDNYYNYGAFYNCTSLESIDLSPCSKLTKIGQCVFSGCTNAVIKLPASITEVKEGAFRRYYNTNTYCEKVLVPNEEIKKLVKDSGYPENRIEMY